MYRIHIGFNRMGTGKNNKYGHEQIYNEQQNCCCDKI